MRKIKTIISLISSILLIIAFSGCSALFYSRTSPDLKKSEQEIQLPQFGSKSTEELGDNVSGNEKEKISTLKIFYYNSTTDSLEVEIKEGRATLEAILGYMRETSKNKALVSAISRKTQIVSAELTDNVLIVDLAASFVEEKDVLVAGAAVVNSFIANMSDIQYVKLTIDGKTYSLDKGSQSGLLNEFPLKLEEVRETGILPGKNKTLDANLYFADITNKYILSTVREIAAGDVAEITKTIIQAIEKGPLANEIGYLPTAVLPLGLINVEYEQLNTAGVTLYFDNQWVEAVKQSNLLPIAIASSLIESINVEWVKIYYQNANGTTVDGPINNFPFQDSIKPGDLRDYQGRRVNVYYADNEGSYLKTEVRAIPRQYEGSAQAILNLTVIGPVSDALSATVPAWVTPNGMIITVQGTRATVDLPVEITDSAIEDVSERIFIYSIVNALTDTQNSTGIQTVLFTQEGKPMTQFGSMDISEGLTWNSTLIR
jgi:hypothetical protein